MRPSRRRTKWSRSPWKTPQAAISDTPVYTVSTPYWYGLGCSRNLRNPYPPVQCLWQKTCTSAKIPLNGSSRNLFGAGLVPTLPTLDIQAKSLVASLASVGKAEPGGLDQTWEENTA